MAIPEDHLAKFHKMTDAKDMWEAIKSRFGEGLHKGYDRFQNLLSQLEIHGAGVSTEDANQKFLRSLPSSWSQVSLIMRTKPGVDTLSFDDLYNNLRVFESDVKGSTASSSSTQNVAENSSSYTDELMYSFFANQSSGPQLDHEDLEQLDEFDLEEMDLKWQVAMISLRLKKFYKKTGRKLQFDAKEPVGFDMTKVECFNCHKTGHFARECRSKGNQDIKRRDAGNTGYKAKDNKRRPKKQEEPKALVTLDGDGVDWTGYAEDEQENFALMAYNNSRSDTDVTSCSKECVEAYAKLKKIYDEQREQLGDASIEIKAYTLALAKKLLAEAVKEKEELKINLKNFQSSSKGLSKLLKSQMSAKDKSGLGSSDVEDSPVYDRFAKVKGMHAVPSPMTGNNMPQKSDFGIDELNFTYGQKQSKTSESTANTSDFDSCKTNSSVETLESVPEPVLVKPKVFSQPKVWSDAPIIQEYESDSDDEFVIKTLKEQEKPSFAFVNIVKHVKTHRETFKEQNTCSPCPKVDKRDWNGLMYKKLGLGYGFTKKACFNGKATGQGENRQVDPQKALKNKGIVDSGCSRHMTRNNAYLVEYQDYNGGPVAFGGSECLVLSPDFKLPDENQVLLRVPKQNNMYSFNLENIVPTGGLACLIAKAIVDKYNKWHRRLGHVNFKNLNKLVKGNLKRGLPSKIFQNDHTFVACQKGKQHKASWKGPNWLFDIDYLTDSMNYHPVTIENKVNKIAGPKEANHSAEIEEGEGSEQPTEPQPTPSPTQPSIGDQPYVTDSSSGSDNTHSPSINLGGTGGNNGDQVQLSNDSPQSGGNTSERSKGGLNLEELLSLCTNLSNKVLALETFKDAQAAKIFKLKTRIKKLEKKCKPIISHHKAWLKRPTLDAFNDLDADLAHGMDYMDTEEAVTEGRQRVSTAVNISTASRPEVSTATPMTPPTTTSVFEDEDIFLADALPLLRIDPKDKGKGVLEEEPKPVKVKSKDQGEAQIKRDAEIALKVQAELDEEARLERQRQEQVSMNYIACLYDEVQARIYANHELAVLYIKEHERIVDFVPIGSERDERMIEKMNKKAAGVHEEKVLEEPDSTKVEVKQEGNKESTIKRPGRRLNMKATKKSRMQKRDFDLEEEEHLKTFLKLVPDEEEIIDYEVLEKRFLIINWESKFYHLDRH
ncbi:ribonuclease H-like domain-containing protein [Tanacetum coccineum]